MIFKREADNKSDYLEVELIPRGNKNG